MSDISTTSWSEVDASNNQTPPEGWPAGMFPNAVEPSARMNMGAVKRFWGRVNPVYAAVLSTTDTFTVTPTQALVGYGLYERWSVRFPSSNITTSPTINISSLGAQPFRKWSSGSLVNVAVGDIQAQDHDFWWDGSRMVLKNPAGSGVTNLSATTNGGLVFSAAIGAITVGLQPSTLPTKAALTSQDSILVEDAAGLNVAKTALPGALLNSDANVGYQNVPQNSKSAAYTTVLADAGKHIYHPAGDTTARTWTIDSNANVPYTLGSAITFINEVGAGNLSLTINTSDTLVWASGGSTGTRTLSAPGMATAVKVLTNRWMISGTGLS